MAIAKDASIDKSTPIRFQESTTMIQLTLGKRKIRQQQNSSTPSGQRQRKKVMKEISMTIHGTCYNIIHKHVLERKTICPPTSNEHNTTNNNTIDI